MQTLADVGPLFFGVPVAFLLFGSTLVGVAMFHQHTLRVALLGLAAIVLLQLFGTQLDLVAHLAHEWVILANLFLLLVGFALLAHHFEASGLPARLPKWLPDGATGAFVLLVLVFVLSAFLDNIAAAMIGGTVAATVFQRKVHIGYVAAIVAASNGGGSGSVVGDTTTTMMWIDGKSPLAVLTAYLGSVVALVVFGIIAARQQNKHAPIVKDAPVDTRVDPARLLIVAAVLVIAMVANIVINTRAPEIADHFPFLGVAVWLALLAFTPLRKPDWHLVPSAAKGSVFLLTLVLCASLMPVSSLPAASWQTTFGLGVVSSMFDNIPLTKLALEQGGYDWGVLAYAVGFGGSMLWFGSSAGVAISNIYPEARSVGQWLRHGWHVPLAFVIGYAALIGLGGWSPS